MKNIDKIINDAGFVRFSAAEDPHEPIDWSNDYDYELKEFARLLVIECAHIAAQHSTEAAQAIKARFGVE